MDPAALGDDLRGYAAGMRARDPALPADFFRVKKAGRLTTGIGSSLDEKYLLRVEGWTEGEGDDQILEAKLVRPLPDSACVHTDAGPSRVPLAMSLIARAPFEFSGLAARAGRVLFVHAWTDDYVELKVEFSFPKPCDLRQVAYDVGTQLGRAHPREGSGRPSRPGLRASLLESTRANDGRIRALIDELTEATVEAWTAFRADIEPG
jgi:hypothetical protein